TMNTTPIQTSTVRHRSRAFGLGTAAVALSACLALGACSKSTNNGSSTSSGSSGGSGGSTSAATWTTGYCSTLSNFMNSMVAEQNAFNALNPPDAPTLKTQEIAHVNKYLSIVGGAITQIQGSGYPSIPDGHGYVSGYLKAFQTYQSSLQAALASANALDPTTDTSTFNTALGDVTTSVNNAANQFQTDWNNVDGQFTNPGDNPLVDAMNNNKDCDNFRNGGSSSSTTAG
ncbi:MAG TPA: hypothetical protein VMU77_06975, partial [Acidimicrobiales bacterium]|nr:hypothetical protein [Acidimicrobiales bacterium]